MPDIVGDALRTLELFEYFSPKFSQFPRALVMQDGQEKLPIPWDHISSIFIGGTDLFKDGKGAMSIAKTAKILGKWVHVGRINSVSRVRHWKDIADSCDGSGLSKYDAMLSAAIKEIKGELTKPYEKMPELWDAIETPEVTP
jgi:hypothetical protein